MVRILFFILSAFLLMCTDRNAGAQADGQTLFRQNCVFCHGVRGDLRTNGAHDLRSSAMGLEERMLVISQGRNLMTGFGDRLTQEQIRKVAEYSMSLREQSR